MFDLTGKTALLTGASKGMGLAMAKALAGQGALVVISSRKQDQLDVAAAEINETTGRECAIGIAANVGYRDQLETLVARTRSAVGPVDILIGNAGVNPYYGKTSEIPDTAYDKIMTSNVQSNLWLAQLLAPDMIAKGRGSLIFTASVGAYRPSDMLGHYGMSKLALIGLVRNLALEFGPKGIRCNAICPGVIKTDFAKELWDNPEAEERARNDVPLRRLGEPSDFSGLAVYLASDESSYMTGQALTVCGGTHMWA